MFNASFPNLRDVMLKADEDRQTSKKYNKTEHRSSKTERRHCLPMPWMYLCRVAITLQVNIKGTRLLMD